MCTRDRNSVVTSSIDSAGNLIVCDLVDASREVLDFATSVIQGFRLQKHFKEKNRRAGIAVNRKTNIHQPQLAEQRGCVVWYNYDLDMRRYEETVSALCRRTASNLRLLRVTRVRAPLDTLDFNISTITAAEDFCRNASALVELINIYEEKCNPKEEKKEEQKKDKVEDDITGAKQGDEGDLRKNQDDTDQFTETSELSMDETPSKTGNDSTLMDASDVESENTVKLDARTGNYAAVGSQDFSEDEEDFENLISGWNLNAEGDESAVDESSALDDAMTTGDESQVEGDQTSTRKEKKGADAKKKEEDAQSGASNKSRGSEGKKKRKKKSSDITLNNDDLEALRAVSESFAKLCGLFMGILNEIRMNSSINQSVVLITAASSCFTELNFILARLRKLCDDASSFPSSRCPQNKAGRKKRY